MARRLHGAFLSADRVFSLFRSGFVDKSSPSHLLQWGSFDPQRDAFFRPHVRQNPGDGFPESARSRAARGDVRATLVSAGFGLAIGGFEDAASRVGLSKSRGLRAAAAVKPRGFRTYVLPAGERDYELLIDTISGGGAAVGFPTGASRPSRSPARRSHGSRRSSMRRTGGYRNADAPTGGGPNEVEEAVPFAEDDRPRHWDAEIARRLHGAFLSWRWTRVFETAPITARSARGRSSPEPSVLRPTSFDLEVTLTYFQPAGTPARRMTWRPCRTPCPIACRAAAYGHADRFRGAD